MFKGVFVEEAFLTVGHETYAGKDEIESFGDDLFDVSPNMTYVINQTDLKESMLVGILEWDNVPVFEFEIEYDPDTNLITDAVLTPGKSDFMLFPFPSFHFCFSMLCPSKDLIWHAGAKVPKLSTEIQRNEFLQNICIEKRCLEDGLNWC